MPHYRERLWPAPWLFIATALVIPASLLVFLPIDLEVGIAVAVDALCRYAWCCCSLASPSITVTSDELIAGRARIPLALVGEVAQFSRRRGARRSAGPDSTRARGS